MREEFAQWNNVEIKMRLVNKNKEDGKMVIKQKIKKKNMADTKDEQKNEPTPTTSPQCIPTVKLVNRNGTWDYADYHC